MTTDSDQIGQPAKLTRRQLLKATGSITGAAVFATGSGSAAAKEVRPPRTDPFVEKLPIPRIKEAESELYPSPQKFPDGNEAGRDDHQGWEKWPPRKFYKVVVKEEKHSFHRNLPEEEIWGYDGTLPGPTFVCFYNEPILVRFHNKLKTDNNGYGSPEISTHLHNLHCASESDGYTDNYFSSSKCGSTIRKEGDYYDHHYPNSYAGSDRFPATNGDPREALGTLWYHDHREGYTAANVYRGLAGFYLLFDELDSNNEEAPAPAFGLPSGVGKYDIPLAFQDFVFDSSGRRTFDQFETDGILGNKFCVNGKVQPYFNVAPRKYRFRMLNASTSRFYEFFLSYKAVGKSAVDQTMIHIGNDGNLLPAPLTAKSIRIAPAERADIVIDFSAFPAGSELFLVNRLSQDSGRGPGGLVSPGTEILKFSVSIPLEGPDKSRVPAKLRSLPEINLAESVKNRTFEFDRLLGVWTINGKIFDTEKPAITVKQGTAEIWTLKGKGSWHHPVHIHLEEARILSRNGRPPPPHEQGRKDVVVLNPGEEVKIFVRFRDFVGKYMMHCHNTVHEDHAMMLRFDIEK